MRRIIKLLIFNVRRCVLLAENKNQTFMKGAIILVVANVLVKLIGAMFKIPLARLLGTTGMGMFNMSYTIYTMLFIVATAGIPVAISKIVSESRAKGRSRDVGRILLSSLLLLGIIAVLGAGVLYFGAEKFSELVFDAEKFGDGEKASVDTLKYGILLGIQALAPAMFFVSFMSAFRGFFQGTQNMYPTAISEVVEAIGKLLLGILFASMLMPKGVHFASAGAVFGVSAGAFLGFLSLVVSFLYKRKSILSHSQIDEMYKPRTIASILKELVVIAVPITIGASVFSLTSVIDMLMIARRLGVAGFSGEEAMSIWGAYSGFAVPLFNMPPTLITAISISLVPAIAGAFVTGKNDFVKKTTGLSLKMTIMVALPCAVGISILSAPILQLVYDDALATNIAATPLSILSYAIVFVSLVMVTNSMLQATGHTITPVVHMAIGGVVKVLVNYTLVGIPHININGAPIGSTLCYITILILNIVSIRKIIGIKFSIADFVVKPIVSVFAMAVVVLALYSNITFLGNTISTVLSIVAGAIVYFAVLLLVGGIKAEDLEMIPKGEKLVKVLKTLKILR